MRLSPGVRLVVAIWLVFLCKGVFYAALFPMWEGYDEFAHFAFVQHLATHHELTVPENRISREIERSLELVPLPRPLTQLLSAYTNHDDYWKLPADERLRRQNDLLRIPVVAQSESGTAFLYEGKQAPLYYWFMWPIHAMAAGTTLPNRVFLFRLMNILLASLAVPIAFITARRVFLNSQLAVAVSALIASMPELYVDAARVGNQVLAMILYSLFTLLCLKIVHKGTTYLPLAGVVLGLLMLTKAYCIAAVPSLMLIAIRCVIKAQAGQKARIWWSAIAAFSSAIFISAWWYLRNYRLSGAIMWFDAAPSQSMTLRQILRHAATVKWLPALDSLVASHVWFGNWSFLSVRSWMYRVFEFGAVLAAVGLFIIVIRAFRSRAAEDQIINPDDLFVLGSIYGAFIAALAYQTLMNSINFGVGASAGWYLYTVIVPEVILITAGLLAFRWGKEILAAGVMCFFALEMYATHFVLIPYYTGLIAHVPKGGLRSFHVSQLKQIGLTELLARLEINRPLFMTNPVWLTLWCLFLLNSAALVYIALMVRKADVG